MSSTYCRGCGAFRSEKHHPRCDYNSPEGFEVDVVTLEEKIKKDLLLELRSNINVRKLDNDNGQEVTLGPNAEIKFKIYAELPE